MMILVTGGAGFVGSHVLRRLLQGGHSTVTFDNLERGHREALLGSELIVGDLRRYDDILAALKTRRFDAVVHFAAYAYVGESVEKPLLYYENNVGGTLNLLRAMQETSTRRLIFSSSCAVYGEPRAELDEEHSHAPLSPYGATKSICERMIADAAVSGLRSVSLRYFNAAGAAPDGMLAERHDPETHLLPLAIDAALGRRQALTVFGRDYPTPDGTCIRDYVHVDDLADAHVAALEHLDGLPGVNVFNLGSGDGYSVSEVIESVGRAVGAPVPFGWAARRPGDPAKLVAAARKAEAVLGWRRRYRQLDEIVATAVASRRSL